jgi:hypothetical protein
MKRNKLKYDEIYELYFQNKIGSISKDDQEKYRDDILYVNDISTQYNWRSKYLKYKKKYMKYKKSINSI